MSMTFVNHRGEPVLLTPVKAPARSSRPAADAYHKGWLVVGYSPTQLAQARAAHEHEAPDKPFDEAAYMRKAKPVKARSQPYQIFSSAEECAEMLRRAGWRLVQVTAKAKGEK